ncbi:iron dicitrate transport regulator FecR [Siphonobacter sp. BAB-5405]|uniref:FecR domain-containing protein n=1 Tax=Siphonobacter sp. BAB-5405 TaxID=1864825 RepID=UPI000C80C8B9|nr:FecR domain-containing protein [Siphonobacter sp. BAB-5405]PMD88461.1 iron dicitrate transport regulator FecR [Siphonobacter sp. BAB-5405]
MKIDSKMDDLLVKYMLHETSIPERKRVEAWLRESDRHQQYYAQFRTIWQQSQPSDEPLVVDEQIAWEHFQQRIQKPSIRSIPRFRGWIRAAVVLLMLGIGWQTYMWMTPAELLSVQSGNQPQSITLPDGSSVTLNRHSSLRYDKTFRRRRVHLTGEAFFSIQRDPSRPFTVEVNTMTVRVLGTSFNVKQTDTQTEVVVKTGHVEVRRQPYRIDLRPQEKAIVPTDERKPEKLKIHDDLDTYYHTKTFVCRQTPLRTLIRTINEAYGVQIRIARPELEALPLTTTLPQLPLESVLEIIAHTLQLKIERQGNQFLLK